jgi:hypothetical protein
MLGLNLTDATRNTLVDVGRDWQIYWGMSLLGFVWSRPSGSNQIGRGDVGTKSVITTGCPFSFCCCGINSIGFVYPSCLRAGGRIVRIEGFNAPLAENAKEKQHWMYGSQMTYVTLCVGLYVKLFKLCSKPKFMSYTFFCY